MSWTAALKARVASHSPSLRLLVKLEITDPTTLTLRLSDAGYADASYWWPPCVCGAGRVMEPGDFLDPGPQIPSWSFNLPMKATPQGLGGAAVADMLQAYELQEAKVTAYVCDASLPFSDAAQVFVGYVNRLEISEDEVHVLCLGDRTWNTMVPLQEVTTANYIGAPEASKGAVLPILVGEGGAINLRDPWLTPYTAVFEQWQCGGGRPTAIGVLVDTGIAGAKAKVVVAGHRVGLAKSDKTQGCFIGMELMPGVLSIIEDAATAGSGITEVNTATEAGFTVDDEKLIAYTPVLPTDIRVTGTNPTNVTNPRAALDPKNEVDGAAFDTTTGKNQLTLILPSLAGLGTILAVEVFVAMKGRGANTGNMRARPLDPASGAFGTTVNCTVGTGNPAVYKGTWDAAWWTQQWDFGGNGTHAAIDLSLDMTAVGTAGQAEVLWACLVVKHRVQLSLVTPASPARTETRIIRPTDPDYGPGGGWGERARFVPIRIPELPAVYQLTVSMLGAFRGLTDTAGGAYSGSASSVLTKLPDVIRGLMVEVAGVSGSDFETGAGVFGSFVDARFLLRAFQPDAPDVAFQLTQRTTMLELLGALCRQLGAGLYLDPEDGVWRIYRWEDGDKLHYSTRLQNEWLHSFEVEKTTDVELVQGCVVRWFKDAIRGRSAMETFVRSNGSGRGYNYPELRDEQFEVTTTNRKFDYDEAGTPKVVTLGTGARLPIDVAKELENTIIINRANLGYKTWFGYGTQIKLNEGDTAEVVVGGVTYHATVAEAEYTPHTLAEATQDALNALGAGRTWTVVYNDSTNQYEVSATGGTWTLSVVNWPNSLWPALGINTDQSPLAGVNATVQRSVYARKFWWMTSGWNIGVKFASGANNANTCCFLLGFDKKDRTTGTVDGAIWQVGNLEVKCADLEAKYRRKRIVDVDLWAVRGEMLAIDARRRTMMQRTRPRVKVRFSTTQAPDLKKGMVFKFDGSLDSRMPVPSLGRLSWQEMRFRVVERSRSTWRTHEVTFTAVEA